MTMNRSTLYLAMAVLLLATLLISTVAVSADQPPVEITLWSADWSPKYHEAGKDQTVILRAGWGACTPGWVYPFVWASNFEVTLDGALLLSPNQVDELWSDPAPASGLEAYCGYKQNPHSAEWRYQLDTSGLEPGIEYLIHTVVTLDHPVRDGADYDGDGKPDKFPAGLYDESIHTLVILDD
jgi:hypothetical protein